MEGREIPGFYYDPDLKKYFRIQPNHNAAPGSKYSAQNVKQETSNARKRKRTDRHNARLLRQTVRPSPMLGQSHVKATLGLELGVQRRPASAVARASTVCDELSCHERYRVNACYACGTRHIVHDFAVLEDKNNIVVGVGDGKSSIVSSQHVGRRSSAKSIRSRPYSVTRLTGDYRRSMMITGLTSALVALDVTTAGTVLATSQSTSAGNVAIARLPTSFDTDDSDLTSMMLKIGIADEQIDCSSPSPTHGNNQAMIITSNPDGMSRAIQLDLASGNIVHGKILAYCPPASTDWLDRNTSITAYQNGSIVLWDLRTAGTSCRYTDSHIWEVRGSDNGLGIWTATPNGLTKYDVRMPRRRGVPYGQNLITRRGKPSKHDTITPVYDMQNKESSRNNMQPIFSDKLLQVSFPHFTANNPAMAMWDDMRLVVLRSDDNTINLFSMLDGSLVKRLVAPHSDLGSRPWITRIRPTEDDQGRPSLMYNIGYLVESWTYGGSERDNEDEMP